MFLQFLDRSLLESFAGQSESLGLRLASQTTLDFLGVSLELHGQFATTGAQLIIANHPSSLDGLILLSQIPREDVYTVAAVANSRFGPTFTDHMLPVYLSHQPKHYLIDYLRIPVVTRMEGNVSREEAMTRNRATIDEAAQRLNNGQTVIIFPGGSNPSPRNPWKKGVGFLLKSLSDPDTQIVFAHIEGTDWGDSLRPTLVGQYAKRLSHTHVIVDTETHPLSFFDQSKTGQEIAAQLETMYRQSWPDR